MTDHSATSLLRLEERLNILEGRFDERSNGQLDTWQTEYIENVRMRVVRMVVARLEAIHPGISEEIRRDVEEIEYTPIERSLGKFPEMKPVADWQKARVMEIIAEMLPCSDEP